jgi:MFS transporter, DHA1 family, multidrug resistance protein
MQTPIFLNRRTPPKLVTLILLAGISALTMNIFLPSLPGMAAYFDAPYALMQLSVALYLALSAVLQVLIGPISDRYGRRVVILAALVLFLIATLGTLFASTVTGFLICRMAQAVVATGMALSRAVVRDMVEDDEAASMIAYVTMGMSLVPMLGPVAGGYLDAAFGWHANFWLLFGLGLLVLALVWADLGETAVTRKISLAEQMGSYPALLRSQRFLGYSGAAAFSSGCFFAYLGGAPYVGNVVFGLDSKQIGLLFAITALGYTTGNFFAARVSRRLGINRMVLIGTLITVVGLTLLLGLTLLGLSGPVVFFGLQFSMGLGNGVALPSANAGILSVRPEFAGTASGLGGALTIGGGAGLAALAGALLPPGSSELPLVLLMLCSALISVLCILLVIRRARALGLSA